MTVHLCISVDIYDAHVIFLYLWRVLSKLISQRTLFNWLKEKYVSISRACLCKMNLIFLSPKIAVFSWTFGLFLIRL